MTLAEDNDNRSILTANNQVQTTRMEKQERTGKAITRSCEHEMCAAGSAHIPTLKRFVAGQVRSWPNSSGTENESSAVLLGHQHLSPS